MKVVIDTNCLLDSFYSLTPFLISYLTSPVSRLLESIKVENGQWHHLPYHEQRIRRAQQALFGKVTITHLADRLTIPKHGQQGLYKCRIVYQEAIEEVAFIPYQPKTIRTLRRVHCDDITYDHKYENRRLLNELFDQRGDCDDVLIIKGGLVTDTSYANVVFFDGQRWVTPAHPLLRGTQRQYLLDRGFIEEATVREQDLRHFRQFQTINAFHPLNRPPQVISHIV